jgi:predicted translin family RNA/ssDNA-binding protein
MPYVAWQVQEYVEAATFLEFCKTGKLLTLDDVNNSFSDLKDASDNAFKLNLLDYLLGVGTHLFLRNQSN